MNVLVLYTALPEELSVGHTADEFDLTEAAEEIVRVCPGANIARVQGHAREITEVLATHRPDVVFNLCEAPLGRPDLEAHVAALLELEGIPFTGCGSETLALCRRKSRTKAVLAKTGIRVPRDGTFPCMVKPEDQDGSTGIDSNSVCADQASLEAAIRRIHGPVIVEEFLPGTEYVVSLWGGTAPEHVAIGEVDFRNELRLFTYASKWESESADFKNSFLHYHTEIAPSLRESLIVMAKRVWAAVGARGYLRMDFRLDQTGVPHVIDVNPNPEISPEVGMHRAVTESGWSWDRFVHQQIRWAIESVLPNKWV